MEGKRQAGHWASYMQWHWPAGGEGGSTRGRGGNFIQGGLEGKLGGMYTDKTREGRRGRGRGGS